MVLITFYPISTWSISSACLFIERLVMSTTVSKSMAWPGRGIASVSHTASFLTSTRVLQRPHLQIIATVSFLAEKKIPLTIALGHLVFRLLKKQNKQNPTRHWSASKVLFTSKLQDVIYVNWLWLQFFKNCEFSKLRALIFQAKFYLEFWVYIFLLHLIKHCDVKYIIFLIQ